MARQSGLVAARREALRRAASDVVDQRVREQVEAATEAAARAIVDEGTSPNTRRAYRVAGAYLAAWYTLAYGTEFALPWTPGQTLRFVVDHRPQPVESQGEPASDLERKRRADAQVAAKERARIDRDLVILGYKKKLGVPSFATLRHRLAVLAKMHELQRLPNPCRDPGIREVMQRSKRIAVVNKEPRKVKQGMRALTLEKVLATCGADLAGVRDRALLLFSFSSGGRRRSEVAGATLDRLARLPNGDFRYELGISKGNQTGERSSFKPIVGAAAAALEVWLTRARLTPGGDGPIFRRVLRAGVGGAERRPGKKPMNAHAINRMLKRRANQAHVAGNFGAHSLRRGFVTDALDAGVALPAVMEMTEHKSVSSMLPYYGEVSAMRNPAAGLFDRLVDDGAAAKPSTKKNRSASSPVPELVEVCKYCHGAGEVECRACWGMGYGGATAMEPDPCLECDGKGLVECRCA